MNMEDNLVWTDIESNNWDAFESAQRWDLSKLWSGPYCSMVTYNIAGNARKLGVVLLPNEDCFSGCGLARACFRGGEKAKESKNQSIIGKVISSWRIWRLGEYSYAAADSISKCGIFSLWILLYLE